MHGQIEQVVTWIEEHRPTRVAALTGAGISAESGVPTFRDAGGLWETHRAEELATPQAFARDPLLVWRWYEWRKERIRAADPNPAHRALADLESALEESGRFTLITQNVDGLHARAGSRHLIELHGNLFRTRCLGEKTVGERTEAFETLPPACGCGSLLRPDVVWFGEMLPAGAIEAAAEAVRDADLLLVIGTSGVVHPAAGLVSLLRGGAAVEVNPQQTPLSRMVTFSVQSPASLAVPPIVEAILRSVR